MVIALYQARSSPLQMEYYTPTTIIGAVWGNNHDPIIVHMLVTHFAAGWVYAPCLSVLKIERMTLALQTELSGHHW